MTKEEIKARIGSFDLAIEHDRTNDVRYMAKLAAKALGHFGFHGHEVKFIRQRTFCGTTYTAFLDGKETGGYRVYSREDRIGADLGGMISEMILKRISKDDSRLAEEITDCFGEIKGLRFRFIGPEPA